MRRPFSALAWRASTRGARNLALASLLSLLAAIFLLVLQGIRTTRLDYLVITGVLLLLLGVAWVGTRWSFERDGA